MNIRVFYPLRNFQIYWKPTSRHHNFVWLRKNVMKSYYDQLCGTLLTVKDVALFSTIEKKAVVDTQICDHQLINKFNFFLGLHLKTVPMSSATSTVLTWWPPIWLLNNFLHPPIDNAYLCQYFLDVPDGLALTLI